MDDSISMKDYEKKNKNEDEWSEFSQVLTNDASKPRDEFYSSLKNKLFTKQTLSEKFIYYSRFMLNKKYIALASVLFVGVIGLSVGGYFYYSHDKPADESTQLSEAEKKAFFERANSLTNGLTKLSSNALASNFSNQESNDMLAREMFAYGSDFEKDTYIKTVITTEFGKALDKCEYMTQLKGDYFMAPISISEAYYSDYENYSKYYTIDEDGTISSYYLTTTNTSYSYMGGKYAERYTYEDRQMYLDSDDMGIGLSNGSETVQTKEGTETLYNDKEEVSPARESGPEPKQEEIDISAIYENSEIEIITKNGKEYIQVTEKRQMNESCDPQMVITSYRDLAQSDTEDQVVSVTLMNRIDNADYEYSMYLGSVKEENLINRTKTKVEKREILSSVEASAYFVFDIDVEVRDAVDYPQYSNDDYLNWIRENVGVLISATNYSLNYIYSYDTGSYVSSYSDRDFYPEGEKGDKIFEIFNMPNIVQFDYEASYNNGDKYLGINKAKTGTSRGDLIKFFIYDPSGYEILKKEITLAGNKILADVIEYSYDSTEYIDEDEALLYEKGYEDYNYTTYMIIFEYNGGLYSISQTVYDGSSMLLEYDLLNLNDANVFTELQRQLASQYMNYGIEGNLRLEY